MGKYNEPYLVYDGFNGECEFFPNLEEAQEYLNEIILDDEEGYYPDMDLCGVYKLDQVIEYDVLAKKSDFTEEGWEDEGHSSRFEEIWQHKLVNVGQSNYDKAIAYLDSKGIEHWSQTDEHWLEALKIASGLVNLK